MKILYKHRTRGQDVESVHILGMANGFNAHGYTIEYCSPPAVEVGSSADNSANRLFRLASLRPPTFLYEFAAIAYNLVSLRRTSRILAQSEFDFIYERYAFFDFSTYLSRKRGRTPVVLEINGAVGRKDPTHARKIFLKPLALLMEKRLFSAADAFAVVSSSLKESLMEMGIEERRIVVLPNAVELSQFEPGRKASELKSRLGIADKQVIGFIGSFTFWHGLPFLIETMESVLKGNPDAHLLLVGDGKDREKVEQMLREKGIEDRATLTGRVPHNQIADHVAAMDIGVMPNSNDFGSPMKIFEYMAMCKPVVSARFRPIAEVIRDGENGLLFEPGNTNEFASALERLLHDSQLRERIGEQGRRDVESNHTWQSNCEKVLKLLSDLRASSPS